MTKLFTLLFVGLFLTACATTPERSVAPNRAMAKAVLENASSADEADDGDHVYCTREAMIGTRLPQRRVCKTADEWRLISESSKDAVRDIQRMPIPECDPGDLTCGP